jgi:MFS transporter, AAHS family, 3-hydroxyphenylpropionic acid transporter
VQPGNRDRPGHAVATIVCCVLAVFCEGIDLQAAGVAAGGIIPEFKPSPGQLGNFFSASTTGLFFGALIGGRLSDSIGRKRVVLASIVLFGVFSLLTALAPDMQVLYWARLLTGLGLGGALPNLIALVNECSAPDRRSANVALAYSGAPFGGAVASLISMSIAAPHWRLIFIAGGVAPLMVAPIMMAKLRESPAFEHLRAEKAVAGRSEGGSAPGSSVVAILTAGRAIPTLLLWTSFFLGLLTLYLLLSWLPTLLVDHGMTKPQAAGAQIAFNVGGGFAALLMGQVLEGRLRHAGILTTFVALPALILLLSRAPSAPGPTVLIVFALGCAVLAAQSFLYAIAPTCYPTAIRGMGVGAAVAIGRIGSIAGPKLAGLLKAAGHGYSQLLTDLLPIAVIASVTAVALAWYTHRANPLAES